MLFGNATQNDSLHTTLDQLMGQVASESRKNRNQKEISQAGAKSWIRETLNRVMNVSSGVDPLKWWANMMSTVNFAFFLDYLNLHLIKLSRT